jgi:short-subunit dehydrogenase
MSVYGATKAFLTKVSQALNTELAPHRIHVLVSCPGMVSSSFAKRAGGKQIPLSRGTVMTAEFAAQQIWKQIVEKEEKKVFNWSYSLGTWLASTCLPVTLVKNYIWRRMQSRYKS